MNVQLLLYMNGQKIKEETVYLPDRSNFEKGVELREKKLRSEIVKMKEFYVRGLMKSDNWEVVMVCESKIYLENISDDEMENFEKQIA